MEFNILKVPHPSGEENCYILVIDFRNRTNNRSKYFWVEDVNGKWSSGQTATEAYRNCNEAKKYYEASE